MCSILSKHWHEILPILVYASWTGNFFRGFLLSRASEALMRPLISFLCDSTPHKLFGRRPWNSTQRQILLLMMLPWNKILEKSSGSGSGDKNILFTFLLETILLIKGSFRNFAHEDIIDHQIISNGKKNTYLLRKWLF